MLGLCCSLGFSLVVKSLGFSLLWLLLLQSVGSRASELQQLRHAGSVVGASRLQDTGLEVVVHRLRCSMASGIFLHQGLNLCFLHWQVDSLPLSYQGSAQQVFFNCLCLSRTCMFPVQFFPEKCYKIAPSWPKKKKKGIFLLEN